jgi:hypothetical protein
MGYLVVKLCAAVVIIYADILPQVKATILQCAVAYQQMLSLYFNNFN